MFNRYCNHAVVNSSVFLFVFGICTIITRRFVISYCKQRKLIKDINNRKLARNENVDSVRLAVCTTSTEILDKRRKILSASFDELRISLQNDTFTPTEVLEVYQARALKVHQLTNCICEFLLEAKSCAAELESKYYKKENKPLLYGIPISVKECFKIKGHDSTIGFAQFLNQPAAQDGPFITLLKSLGAIPFVLTNIPQTMKSLGCSNPVYGPTCNPYDISRTCGGSSGGEGALIALRGSVLGIGTDIGGSVRVPAHFCGIFSLKPTAARLDQRGRRGAVPGLTAVLGSVGPMAREVDSLVWFFRAVCSSVSQNSMFSNNPYVVPLPFNENLYLSPNKMRVGFYDYDGFLEATPCCKRAVRIAKTLLEQAGHEVIPFHPPNVTQLVGMYLASVVPDGGASLAAMFKNDIVDSKLEKLAKFTYMPLKMKRIFGHVVSIFNSKSAIPYLTQAQDTSELRHVYEKLAVYKQNFIEQWLDANLDCVICPVLPNPAMSSDILSFLGGGSYCTLYNALDFPAGVVPVTTVNGMDEGNLDCYQVTEYLSKSVKTGTKGAVGLPVGVQVVSLPFREEVCLRVMKVLETSLKSCRN